MQTVSAIKIKLAQNKNAYYEKYGAKVFGISGSYSRGEQATSSDIDILVEFDRPVVSHLLI